MRRLAPLLALVPSLASAAELPPMPLHFIRNVGATDPAVAFLVKGRGPDLYFATDEYVFVEQPTSCGPGAVVRVRFEGARTPLVPEGLETLPGVANFYLGNDPALWREGVPMHAGVAYREAWPGIDAIYRGTEGRLKGEFVVAPGADPSRIVLSFVGVTSLTLREDGALVLRTETGALTEEAPVAWEERGSARREVRARFVVLGGDRVGLAVEGRDPLARLVIDPVLDYASYVGGSDGDRVTVVSGVGNEIQAYGSTRSPDFPSVTDAPPAPGSWDLYRANYRLDSATIVHVTFIGGSGDDLASADVAMRTGITFSPDFPVTADADQPTYGGNGDGFVIGLGGSGALRSSTYLGGSQRDEAASMAPGTTNSSCVGGRTWSADFPVHVWRVGPDVPPLTADRTFDGPSDGFVTCFFDQGFVTNFVGGTGDDAVIAVEHDGGPGAATEHYVMGWTDAMDFPEGTSPGHGVLSGGVDAFIAGYAGDFATLLRRAVIGGSGDDVPGSASGMPVGAPRQFVIAGSTTSSDLPLRNPVQAALRGPSDAWVSVVSGGLDELVRSSYLGGSGEEPSGSALAMDGNIVMLGGTTTSGDLPLVRPLQDRQAGGTDAFLARINLFSVPARIDWSTYVGGSGDEELSSLVAGGGGDCTVMSGLTTSVDFPGHRAIQPSPGGGADGFIARICETDVLGRVDPEDALTQVLVDLAGVRESLTRIDGCCANANTKLDDLLDGQDDLRARMDALDAKLDALAAANRGELLRDIETSLFRRECVPWLWLPENAGSLRLALDHLEQRIADAEASGDPRPNIRIARDRLASARGEADAGHYEDACKRLTDTLHALTTP